MKMNSPIHMIYWLFLVLTFSSACFVRCPSVEYFAEYLQLDRRAAVATIESSGCGFDMFPLIRHVVRLRVFELFDKVSSDLWLRFIEKNDSKCILGPDCHKKLTAVSEQVRLGQMQPEAVPSLLRVYLEQADQTADIRLFCLLKEAIYTSLWDILAIFGQISLYQTCSTLNVSYMSRIRKEYMSNCPLRGYVLSFQKIFKLWKLSEEGSLRRQNFQLFLGIHADFKHYAPHFFGEARGEFHHFPWDLSLAGEIASERMVASPVIHLYIYGINPDIIRVLIKQFPEYMSVGWSPGWAHELVIDHARLFPLNFVKTALKMGEVDFDTLEQYVQISDANPLLISFLVDQFEKLDIWDSLKLSRLIPCVWKKSQLENILDRIPSKSVNLNVPAFAHLLAVGVDFQKISRTVIKICPRLFENVKESMIIKLLESGKADETFVLTVLRSILNIWTPSQNHALLAFQLEYSSDVICGLLRPTRL